MSDHVIVCGWGRVGQTIARDIAASGTEVVVIDIDPDRFSEMELPFVEGDALLAPGFVYLRTTSLSSLGSGLVSQTVPANPNLIGKVAVLQTYMVGPSGTQSISAPMVVAVR